MGRLEALRSNWHFLFMAMIVRHGSRTGVVGWGRAYPWL